MKKSTIVTVLTALGMLMTAFAGDQWSSGIVGTQGILWLFVLLVFATIGYAIYRFIQRKNDPRPPLMTIKAVTVEEARNKAFEALQADNSRRAREIALNMKQVVEQPLNGPGNPLVEKAESLMGFAGFVLREYNWAFEANEAYLLTRLFEEVRKAVEAGDRKALEQKVHELDRAADGLPKMVQAFLSSKGAISSRIAPADPVLAQNLITELEGIERECRADPAAMMKLVTLDKKIREALAKIIHADGSQGKCPYCGQMIVGGRYCAKGHDCWLLRGPSTSPVSTPLANRSSPASQLPLNQDITKTQQPSSIQNTKDTHLESSDRTPPTNHSTGSIEPPVRPTLRIDENVQFSVYTPKAVLPEKWYPMLAFAHLEELPPDAGEEEVEPLEEVQRQVEQALGEKRWDYHPEVQSSRVAIPKEGEITLVPRAEDVEFNPPSQTFMWVENVHRADFRLRASSKLVGHTARGCLTVFWGHIILAEIPLKFQVESRSASKPEAMGRHVQKARRYRKIFASYSHKDLAIVEEMERFARTFGDEYLRDWVHLRAGEHWNDRLKELIRSADLFQLFWSHNARESNYVEQEWRYACALPRPNFVRPTYWEDPCPPIPSELGEVHFQRLARQSNSSLSQPKGGIRPHFNIKHYIPFLAALAFGVMSVFTISKYVARVPLPTPHLASIQREVPTPADYEQRGSVQLAQGNLTGALASYSQSLKLYQNLPSNERQQAACYQHIASTQQLQGKHKEAMAQYQLALKLYQTVQGTEHYQADCCKNIGVALGNLGKHEEAMAQYQLALKLYQTVQGTERDLADCYNRIGSELSSLGGHNNTTGHGQQVVGGIPTLRTQLVVAANGPSGENTLRPRPEFEVLGDRFKVGTPIEFLNRSTGLIDSYSWRFADEGYSVDKNPIFTFESVGTKTVQLKVRGPSGESSVETTLQVMPRDVLASVKWLNKRGENISEPKAIDFREVSPRHIEHSTYARPSVDTFEIVFRGDVLDHEGVSIGFGGRASNAFQVVRLQPTGSKPVPVCGLVRNFGRFRVELRSDAGLGEYSGNIVIRPQGECVLLNGEPKSVSIPLKVVIAKDPGSPWFLSILLVIAIGIGVIVKQLLFGMSPKEIDVVLFETPSDGNADSRGGGAARSRIKKFTLERSDTIALGLYAGKHESKHLFDVGAPDWFLILQTSGLELRKRMSAGGARNIMKSGKSFEVTDTKGKRRVIKVNWQPVTNKKGNI
ncbi:MAG: tetratricopeptide repeat protein [Verrucomicrobia bacterium]|nr:tetratricopeptide repeat protein [Verrucomicrobiota bacterium]